MVSLSPDVTALGFFSDVDVGGTANVTQSDKVIVVSLRVRTCAFLPCVRCVHMSQSTSLLQGIGSLRAYFAVVVALALGYHKA